ncbi:hypothetical protein RFI_40159, partial [Reticulomyxa filosa]
NTGDIIYNKVGIKWKADSTHLINLITEIKSKVEGFVEKNQSPKKETLSIKEDSPEEKQSNEAQVSTEKFPLGSSFVHASDKHIFPMSYPCTHYCYYFFLSDKLMKKQKFRWYKPSGSEQREIVFIEQRDPIVEGKETESSLIIKTMEGKYLYFPSETEEFMPMVRFHNSLFFFLIVVAVKIEPFFLINTKSTLLQTGKPKDLYLYHMKKMASEALVGSKAIVNTTKTVPSWIIFSKDVKAKKSVSVTRLCVENGVICAWTNDRQELPVEDLKVKKCVVLFGCVIVFKNIAPDYIHALINSVEQKKKRVSLIIETWLNDYPILADDKLAHEKIMDTAKRLADAEKTIAQHSAQFTDLMEKVSKIEQDDKKKISHLKEQNDKKKIRHLKEQNDHQMEQIETLKRENDKQIGKMFGLKEGHEQQIKKLQEEKQQLQTQVKRHEQSATENETHKDELHRYKHKIKQLESEFQVQETQLENTKTKLHEYVLLTEKNRSSLSSLHLEKDSAINELENCRQQFNEFKEYYSSFFLTIYNLYL